MINRGIRKKLEYADGRYSVDIDITTSEWLEMLNDKTVFDENSLDMVIAWYLEDNHQSTSKNIMCLYGIDKKSSPYNGTVEWLSKRILEYLNYRFYVESNESATKESYWCIPFEGWHTNYDSSNHFVWKVRDELALAIEEFLKQDNNEYKIKEKLLELNDFESFSNKKDGKKIMRYTTTYERKSENRAAAIKINKEKYGELICEVCGFNFERAYGERGKDFIEVHHNKPLSEIKQEVEINPRKDLNCLCSNCHRMIHRDKGATLSVNQLKKMINKDYISSYYQNSKAN